ncbi:HHHH-motif protein [Paraburkholderia kururiensis]|uniref:HHHH-motif protein n=1 Tax=Paraburkholderia kururiensis TaxID=984307 RepID=UPI00398B9FB7
MPDSTADAASSVHADLWPAHGSSRFYITPCTWMRSTALSREAGRMVRRLPGRRMKSFARILTAAVLAPAVLAPTLAEARSHRVCHVDHHHQRVCHWVR